MTFRSKRTKNKKNFFRANNPPKGQIHSSQSKRGEHGTQSQQDLKQTTEPRISTVSMCESKFTTTTKYNPKLKTPRKGRRKALRAVQERFRSEKSTINPRPCQQSPGKIQAMTHPANHGKRTKTGRNGGARRQLRLVIALIKTRSFSNET